MQCALQSKNICVLINLFGAEICSIKNRQGLEYIWQADPAFWARHAPVLFPIVGKLKNDTFTFENKNYSLTQHGFARDMKFENVFADESSCVFRLTSNSSTLKCYPFAFIFEIKYQLVGNCISTFYKIKNQTEIPIYFSVGAHPAFNCPLVNNDSFEDYYLKFEKPEFVLSTIANGLRTGEKIKLTIGKNKLLLSEELFDHDALIFENNQINKISLCSLNTNHQISLNCKGWPNFGIWTKKGSNKFICLEPWFGIADDETTDRQIITKKGILALAPFNEFNCSYSLTFS